MASSVKFGVRACGSTIQCRMPGLPDLSARSKKAGAKSSVRTIRSPNPPKSRPLYTGFQNGFVKVCTEPKTGRVHATDCSDLRYDQTPYGGMQFVHGAGNCISQGLDATAAALRPWDR